MKRIIITLCVVVAAAGFLFSQLSRLAVDTSLSTWYDNAAGFNRALAAQKDSGKPIAVFFYTDWCTSCKQLKSNVLGQPEITRYIQKFIPIKINPERSVAEQNLARQFGVYGYPTFLIKRSDNSVVTRITVDARTKPEQFITACNLALNSSPPIDSLSGT